MYKLFLLALTLAVASASSQAEWVVFKQRHNKNYVGDEDVIRRYIWQANLKSIEEHNELYAQGKVSFYMKENEYCDMTNEEVKNVMNGMDVTVEYTPRQPRLGETEGLPDTVDWRTKGYVTEVKNQGQCGSCWAFSTTGSLEGAHFKSKGQLVSLSESNLVDCSKKYGNNGCRGGLMDNAFRYIIANGGIDTEASYPYAPMDRPCKYNPSNVGSTEAKFTDVEQGSESALQNAAATVGPISVAIDASHPSFQKYGGGVYSEPACSSTRLDHGVLVVGYGTENGQDYWLVKNSWGASWGENGYIKMSRNRNNQCGIASMASYPTV